MSSGLSSRRPGADDARTRFTIHDSPFTDKETPRRSCLWQKTAPGFRKFLFRVDEGSETSGASVPGGGAFERHQKPAARSVRQLEAVRRAVKLREPRPRV